MMIKHVWPAICFVLFATGSQAQSADPPKEEFKLFVPVTTLSIEKGKADSLNVAVVRSRAFKTGTPTFKVDAPAVKGLVVTIKPLPAQPDRYVMHVSANAEAQPGEYHLVPVFTLRNKTKGIVVKLIIR